VYLSSGFETRFRSTSSSTGTVPAWRRFDGVLETVENSVRRSSRVKPFETVPLDVLDELWGRALPGFDASDLEIVVAGDLPEVLRQRAGVALALRHERHPVVVSFVFQPNFDALRDLRRERLEVLAVIVVDVGVRGHPDGVDDPVDDAPAPVSSRCFAISRISRANALIASWHSMRPNFALLNP